MRYSPIVKNDKIIIKNVKNFKPKQIFECGQAFRWNEEEDGSFTGVALKKVINVKKEGNDVIFSNTNKKDFENIWYNYFDLDRDYDEIKRVLSKDPVLAKAIEFGDGIRVLNQDEWEILISFIISANNRITKIKNTIEKLSEEYGEYIETYRGKKRYSFPLPEVLDSLSVEEVRKLKTGFRAKYIVSTASAVANREIDIYRLKNLSTENARKELMLFSGVGKKVSDCILLFSMNKNDAFPIDVWVKRVMEYFYFDNDSKLEDIQKYAQNKFGEYAGFAQQYLFYYARELGVGK